MRICVVSRSVKSHTVGGMEYHIDILTRGLERRGHSVTILTTGHPEGDKVQREGGLEIRYLPETKPGVYSSEWWKSSDEEIKRMIAEDEVDIFHSQSIACYGALDAIAESGLGLVTTSHGTPITDAISQGLTAGLKTSPLTVGKTLSYFKHHRAVYRSSNQVIAVSEQLAEHIAKWGFASAENVVTIPNGIDLARFKPGLDTTGIKESLGLGDEKILLFIGRVRREKGVDQAIKALPHIQEKAGPVKLIIVGEGDFDDKISPLAKSVGVEKQVVAVGKVEEKMVPVYHNLADAFLMPSTRWEALPLSLLEAIACGSSVVASRVGGIPSVIHDGKNGILVEKGSLDDLVQGCLQALSPASHDISANARKTAEDRFDAEKMVDSVLETYETAMS